RPGPFCTRPGGIMDRAHVAAGSIFRPRAALEPGPSIAIRSMPGISKSGRSASPANVKITFVSENISFVICNGGVGWPSYSPSMVERRHRAFHLAAVAHDWTNDVGANYPGA